MSIILCNPSSSYYAIRDITIRECHKIPRHVDKPRQTTLIAGIKFQLLRHDRRNSATTIILRHHPLSHPLQISTFQFNTEYSIHLTTQCSVQKVNSKL